MKAFFKLIGKRLRALVAKMISMKFFFAIVATIMNCYGKLDDWVWLTVILGVITVRGLEKKIDKIQIGRGSYPPEGYGSPPPE